MRLSRIWAAYPQWRLINHTSSIGDSIGYLLVLIFPVVKVNGKPQQSNPCRIAEIPDPSEMKVLAPGEETRLVHVLDEGVSGKEYIVKEDNYKYHPRPHEQFLK